MRVLLILVCMCLSMCAGAQTSDAAIWSSFEVSKEWRKRFTPHLKYQFRLNENYTHLDYMFVDLGASWKFGKHFRMTSAYVFNWKNVYGGETFLRQQWYIHAVVNARIGRFKLANRMQLQTDIEDEEQSEGVWFYRNKTSLRYKVSKKNSVSGYVEWYRRVDEFRPDENGFSRWRYQVSASHEISKRKEVSAGFLVQHQVRGGVPDRIYAVLISYQYEPKWKRRKSSEDILLPK